MIDIIYHMNLRDLQYLSAVANTLHFGRAAEACNVSQPTLSMQLKKLEDELGVQLFERSNKHVLLTAVGRDLSQRAVRILKEASDMKEAAKASRDPFAGDVRLGIFPTLAPYLLPTLAPHLQKRFPKLNMLLVEEKTPALVEQLERGDIDAAVLAMPVQGGEFAHQPLFEEPFMLAVGKSHPLAARKQVTLEDIQNETMLLLEDGHCMREQALSICRRIGVGEANNFRATSLETLRHMVACGRQVTLIPKLATIGGGRDVRYIPFKGAALSRQIGLYWRKTSARAALYEKMAEAVRQEYKGL